MLKKILATLAMLFAAAAFAAVDVNKATAAELDGIKGIGPGISGKILDERKKGNFKDWNDLIERVKGVGEGNAAKFSAEGVTVGGAAYKAAAASKKDDKPVAAKKDEKPAAAAMAKKDDKPVAAKKDEKPAAATAEKAPKAEKAAKGEKAAAADKSDAKDAKATTAATGDKKDAKVVAKDVKKDDKAETAKK